MSKVIVYFINGKSIEIEADRVTVADVVNLNGCAVDRKYIEFYRSGSKRMIAQFSSSSIAGWVREE